MEKKYLARFNPLVAFPRTLISMGMSEDIR